MTLAAQRRPTLRLEVADMTNDTEARGDRWTQNQVRALVAHARTAAPSGSGPS